MINRKFKTMAEDDVCVHVHTVHVYSTVVELLSVWDIDNVHVHCMCLDCLLPPLPQPIIDEKIDKALKTACEVSSKYVI